MKLYIKQHLKLLIPIIIILLFSSIGLYYLLHSKAATTIEGDINGDSVVDTKDLAILASNYHKSGQTYAQGNLSNDPAGWVNVFDFAILARNWGTGSTVIAPDTYIIDGQKMADVKKNINLPKYQVAKAAVIRAGDKHLADPLHSVMDKPQTPPSGSKHDYMSLSPYWWPNPSTPDGLPYIYRDGYVNPEYYEITDGAYLQALIRAVRDLSAAYYFTNQTKYSDKAAQMLRVWFINSATKMTPRLKYVAIIKGNDNDGSAVGLIEGAYLARIVDAVKILELSPSWTTSDKAGFSSWASDYFTWLTTSDFAKGDVNGEQNHGTWANVNVATFGEYIGDHATAQIAVNRGKAYIDTQIKNDGSQPLEMVRTRPWNYSNLNLDGLLSLVQIGEHHENIHLWNYVAPHGGSIHKAIDFLAPYAKVPKTWPYFDKDPWRPYLMTISLRQAASEYNDPKYTTDANASQDTMLVNDYSSLVY